MAKRSGNLALGGLLLAGAGYLVGILTAPKSGKETRKDIKKAANNAVTVAEKDLKKLHSELSQLIAQGKKKAKTAGVKAKSGLDAALDRGVVAKEKARELLSAIHEGDSNDKDLQKAIVEVNKAIDHLKTYINKNTNAKESK